MIRDYYKSEQGSGRPVTSFAWLGGKSELRRARRSSATTGGDPKESATERETTHPPMAGVKSEKLRVESE